MKALGNYILGSRYKSAWIISLLTLLSLALPPLTYILSGTPFALVTMRKGMREGLVLMLWLFLFTSLFGYFSRFGTGMGVGFVISIWLPVWFVSMILRITEAQGRMVLASGVVGLVFVLVLTPIAAAQQEFLRSQLGSYFEQNFNPTQVAEYQQVLDLILPMLSGMIAMVLVISLIITVLLARMWQAEIFNPGGFKHEFYKMYLPQWLSYLTFICLLLSLMDLGGATWILRNFLVVLMVMHIFHGLASVHRVVFERKYSSIWLILMYCFLFLLPYLAIFLVFLGMADAMNKRAQTPSGGGG
jgi:hypothetical protein